VFNVEKCGSVFVVSHGVSRHRQCEDIAFKLDANAVPMDAFADRQLQVEMERQQAESNLREMFSGLMPVDGSPVKRKDIVEMLHKEYGIRKTNCYDLVKKAIITGIIVEIDRTKIKLNL
jgi:hypothetical protein